MKNSGHTISSMDDLLNLPDIGGIVQELRDENVVTSGNGKTMEDKQYTSNHLWQLFLKNAGRYDYRVKKGNRRNYEIDNDLVDILRICNINQMSISDIINAALRAFLQYNRPQLAKYARNINYLADTTQHETLSED